MADIPQETKNPPGNNLPQGQNPQRQEPAIRTMKSDIAAFMKETKPSLIQILSKQAQYQAPEEETVRRPIPWFQIGIGFGAFIVLAASGWLIYQFFFTVPPQKPPTVEETAPASPILVEKTKAITMARNALLLFQNLTGTAETGEREGTFKRLIVSVKETDGALSLLKPKDFFRLLSINPPTQIFESLQDTFFITFFYAPEGPHMALIIPVKNVDRAFAGMIGWESAMQRDLEALFVGTPQPSVIAPFFDKTQRNIDYRYLAINGPYGLGYFIFPPKNLLVITTSEDAIKLIINRLLEAR